MTPPDSPVAGSGLLESILHGVRGWETRSSPHEIKRRVGSAVAPFLGGTATQDLLNTVSESGDNLLATLEPVIALFLGSRAAARMLDHVVDHSVLRAG